MSEYDGKQFVGIDLHRHRSVIVRQTVEGEQLGVVRIANDPLTLGLEIAKAGECPEVVLEATYGWYWAADVLAEAGARVHLAHPLGIKGFTYRRVKNDVRDAGGSGGPAADGAAARGVDRPARHPRVAGASAPPREAGRAAQRPESECARGAGANRACTSRSPTCSGNGARCC
jgi:hypothetical protein